jgi:hypothetical protein
VGLKSLKSLNLTNGYPNNNNNNNNNKVKSKPLELFELAGKYHNEYITVKAKETMKCHHRQYGQYGTHHSYVLVVHTLRVAENEILKLDLPAKRH